MDHGPDERARDCCAAFAAGPGARATRRLIVVAFARIEFWPLTHIPMYSHYRGPANAYAHEHFRDEAPLRTYANSCIEDGLCSSASHWISPELVASDGARARLSKLVRLDVRRRKTGAYGKQLWSIMRDLTARIVASRPEGALPFAPDAPLSEGERDLRALLPALRRSIPDWSHYERLEIVLSLATGDIVLTSLPLAP